MARHVAQQLGLGPEDGEWLRQLEAVVPSPDGIPFPARDDADGLLERVGVDAVDRPEILTALAAVQQSSAWMWLAERAYAAIRADIGSLEVTRPTPDLPASLGAPARCFWIVVFLAAVSDLRRWHQSQAVSDQISSDTLADLGRHIRLYRRRNGHAGLDTQWWIALHFRGALFAIGRLQYAPYRLLTGPAGPLFWYDDAAAAARGAGFGRGDPALGLHIPESGPLTPAACVESFQAAQTFFHSHFEAFEDAVVTCTSWLLDDQLRAYLDERSNIIRFQSRFELVPGARDSDASAFHFVFGRRPEAIGELQPATTLERAIVRHVQQGGHWRVRTGWLKLASQS